MRVFRTYNRNQWSQTHNFYYQKNRIVALNPYITNEGGDVITGEKYTLEEILAALNKKEEPKDEAKTIEEQIMRLRNSIAELKKDTVESPAIAGEQDVKTLLLSIQRTLLLMNKSLIELTTKVDELETEE